MDVTSKTKVSLTVMFTISIAVLITQIFYEELGTLSFASVLPSPSSPLINERANAQTDNPSMSPTPTPSQHPTLSPIETVKSPTEGPTTSPSKSPTKNPTKTPTISPIMDQEHIEFFNAVQDIEFLIHFDRINPLNESNLPNYRTYSTGISPHFYDGPFSLNKTCKQMRFRYLCPPNRAQKYGFNQWSLTLHGLESLDSLQSMYIDSDHTTNSLNMSSSERTERIQKTESLLSKLQNVHGLYSYNIYDDLIDRIHSERKVFARSGLNLLFYGNSHLKQVVLGLLCLLMDIDPDIVINVIPIISYCSNTVNTANTANTDDDHNGNHTDTNNTETTYPPFSFRDTFCLDTDWDRLLEANTRDWNALHLGEERLNELHHTQFEALGIYSCRDDFLQIEMANNVRLFFIFANYQHDKSIFNETKELMMKYKVQNVDITDFDLLVFNSGNPPEYAFEELLESDLLNMKHGEKPVVFLRTWWELYQRYLIPPPNGVGIDFHVDFEKVNRLRDQFPNLIYISSFQRYKKLAVEEMETFKGMKESPAYGHFCNPGLPEHFALSLLHLIDVLTTFFVDSESRE